MAMNFYMNNNIKKLRSEAKLSQQALADACNTVKSKISMLENGVQGLTLTWMERLAKGFTDLGHPVKPSDLLTEQHKNTNDDWVQGQTEWLKTLNEEGRQAYEDLRKLHDKFMKKD